MSFVQILMPCNQVFTYYFFLINGNFVRQTFSFYPQNQINKLARIWNLSYLRKWNDESAQFYKNDHCLISAHPPPPPQLLAELIPVEETHHITKKTQFIKLFLFKLIFFSQQISIFLCPENWLISSAAMKSYNGTEMSVWKMVQTRRRGCARQNTICSSSPSFASFRCRCHFPDLAASKKKKRSRIPLFRRK